MKANIAGYRAAGIEFRGKLVFILLNSLFWYFY